MNITVEVWSDFVCPWCYLTATSLQKLQKSHGVSVIWRSFELRPEGSPPMPEWYRNRIEQMRPQFEAIAKEHYGIEIHAGPWGIKSRKALIGAKFAEENGKGDPYHAVVFSRYWQQGQSIENIDVLKEIATTIGLDEEAFVAALEQEQYDQAVWSDIYEAQAYEITGVPALLFNQKYIVHGAQPYETLVNIVDQITTRMAQA